MSKEKTDWSKCAIHYDNSIVRSLTVAMLVFAVNEWKRTRNVTVDGNSTKFQLRENARRFFNSSYFGEILSVMAPEIDQQTACDCIRDHRERLVVTEIKRKRHCDRHSDV